MKNLKLTSKESTEANLIEDTKAIDIQMLSFSYFQYNMVDYNTFTIATVKGLLRKFSRLLTEGCAFALKASFLLGQSKEKPNICICLETSLQVWAALVHVHRCITYLVSI